MFREVPFHLADHARSYREYVVSAQSLSRTKSAVDITPFGGGFSYNGDGTTTKNRFIIWRVQDSNLELIEQSLDTSLSRNIIRIQFRSSIVKNVMIVEEESEERVCILVLTEAATLHRFIFPHPAILQHQGGKDSIFASASSHDIGSESSYTTLNLGRNVPTTTTASSSQTLVIGCDGNVYHVRLSPPSNRVPLTALEITECRESAGYMKYLTFSRTTETVYGLSTLIVQDSILVFALSREKLRIFSDKGKLLRTIDITPSSSVLKDKSPSLRVQPLYENFFQVVVQVAGMQDSLETAEFIKFGGELDENNEVGIWQEGTIFTLANDVVDFDFKWEDDVEQKSVNSVYAVCQTGEEIKLVGVRQTDNGDTYAWDGPYCILHQPPGAIPPPPTIDVEAYYLRKLFEPALFGTTVLSKALTLFKSGGVIRATIDLEDLEQSPATLMAEIVAEVARQQETQEDYESDVTKMWERFWAICVSVWDEHNQVIGLHVSKDAVYIVRSGSIGVLRVCDEVESSSFSLGELVGSIERDVESLWECCKLVLESLGPNYVTEFEESLSQTVDVAASLFPQINLLVENPAAEQFTQLFIRIVHGIQQPVEAFSILLDALMTSYPTSGSTDYAPDLPSWKSDSAVWCVGVSVRQIIRERYRGLIGLTITLGLVQRLRGSLGLTPASLTILTTTFLDEASAALKMFSAIDWAADQQFDSSTVSGRAGGKWNSVEDQLTSLTLVNSRDDWNVRFAEYHTLIEAFYHSLYNKIHIHKQIHIEEDDMYNASSITLTKISDFVTQQMVNTRNNTLYYPFLSFLRVSGQFGPLLEVIRRIENSSEFTANPLVYLYLLDLKGSALLSLGNYTEASDTLLAVAAALPALARDSPLFEGANTEVFDEPTVDQADKVISRWVYCLKCLSLFDTHRRYDLAAKFALAALPPQTTAANPIYDRIRANMWSNVFAAKIADNDWDGAYSAAVLNPDKARSNDSIRRLVVVLCEKNLASVLAAFPLVGLVPVVTELLAHKAQFSELPQNPGPSNPNSTPVSTLSSVPNYYHILYSFLIDRSNYRGAAAHMYMYAQRIANTFDPTHKPSKNQIHPQQQQASAYLLSLSALRLVEPVHQWISVPVIPTGTQKRKRDDNAQPEEPENRLEIVSILDIEKTYTLVNAQYILANGRDLPTAGLPPNDTFLLLVQENYLRDAFTLADIHKLDPRPALEAWVRFASTNQNSGRTESGVGLGLNSPYIRRWLDVHDAAPSTTHFTVSQVVQKRSQSNTANTNNQLKFHGQLVPKSLSVPNNKPTYEFDVTDTRTTLRVIGKGKPPRELKDWLGVVVEGVFSTTTNNIIEADVVAPARCHEGYHEFIAGKLFTYNRSLALPQWLLSWFKEGRHDALLRIYLQYGRLEEAGKLTLELIQQTTKQLQQTTQQQQKILPDLLIENLLLAIQKTATNWDEKGKERLTRVAAEVQRAVSEYYVN